MTGLDNLYLLPLGIAGVVVLVHLASNLRRYRKSAIIFIKKGSRRTRGLSSVLFGRLVNPDGRIYEFYSARILKFSVVSVEKLLEVKLWVFLITVILAFSIKYTNISIQSKEIFTKLDYPMDLLYQHKEARDKVKALEEEITVFMAALEEIRREEIQKSAEDVQAYIRMLIQGKEETLQLSKDTIANRVYHRLADYYAIRKLNLPIYLLLAFLVSFIPEIFFSFKNIFAAADARRELRFLKKLIIMNGSIPPVDFIKVLDCLIHQSKFYRRILEEIRDGNRRNSVDTKSIYARYIQGSKDVNAKLFFEKLDEANNYDFKQAVVNIENEFRLEKREAARNVRKRIEVIHVVGVTGFMLLVAVMTMYLITPWLKMYNTSTFGF